MRLGGEGEGARVGAGVGAHLGVLPPASGWLKGVASLHNLLGGGGGFVRRVVRALLDHVLALLALWRWRPRAFPQDWRAGGRALVGVTGSAERQERPAASGKRLVHVQRQTLHLNSRVAGTGGAAAAAQKARGSAG